MQQAGADEDVALSFSDVVIEDEEGTEVRLGYIAVSAEGAEEWRVEKESLSLMCWIARVLEVK